MSKEFDMNESNINQLYQLYKEEFINFCENILIENQNEFLDRFYEKMNLIIKQSLGENIFDKIPSLYLTKKQCENNFITDIYWPMREQCLNTKNNFYSNSINIPKYLVNFRPHCIYDQVPLHTCGSKFIPVFDNNIPNKILYVICSECNKCYYSNCIKMNCHYCQINFYSEVINIKNYLFSATWKKYHCNNEHLLINEQMHCILCNNLLYIKNNKLFCKICKEYFDPEDIVWTCKICNTEFKSDIKIYNPYEFKEIEIAIKEAFLYKKISNPYSIPCNCISNNNNKNNSNIFYHEPDGNCKGVMYYSYVNDKEYLVCSLCKTVYELNKFCWKCPICFKKFITKELKFENINKESSNNNIYKKIYKDDVVEELKNNNKKKIHYSSSQKVIDCEKNDNNNNKIYKNKNNSYVKKRINSSFIKTSNINNIISDKSDNPMNKRKKILTNNKNASNDNDNKDMNSLQNKYNIASTAYSSFMNNNNIKEPQTDRNVTYSFILPKNDRSANQNKYKINKYINKKILNFPSTIINNKNLKNQKVYLKSNKYKTIEQYINDFNYVEKSNNKYNDFSNKSMDTDKNIDINKEDFFKTLKNGFRKNRNKKPHEKSFSIGNINDNKSFISQKTNLNQIYFPKKHIHSSSIPLLSTSPLYKSNKNNNLIKHNHSCEKRRVSNNDFINNNFSKLKICSDVKSNSKDKFKINNLNDFLNKKIKKRKKNQTNIFSNLTNNSKGTSISTIDDKYKNENSSDISFKKYIKNNYNKNNKKQNINSNIKGKDETDIFLKLNLDEINNSHNKQKLNKKENKCEYLTSINNHTINNKNKQKFKKANILSNNKNIIKNKKIINKEIQTSRTKNIFNPISKYRNSKKSGLCDIISNFKQIKNSVIQAKAKEKKLNDKKTMNQNNNVNNINDNKKEINQTENKDIIDKQNIQPEININQIEDDELKVFNFEDYKIITQLGQGSFGKIYLVQNNKNELFTMKKLVYSEELDVQSVIKEYKMCYKLKHPNVVKILGIYNNKLDKTTYVVYVLMEVGMTDWEKEIKKHIEKNIFYTEKELIHIIKQLTQVLSFLQKSNISHRDIKPQNILVFKNNVYKIADFGEAKQIENMTINLICNSLRGTELYMSPLLFNGLRTGQVDIRHNVFKSDVYSFGLCILFAASLQMISLYDIRKIVDMKEVRKYLDKMIGNKYSKKFIDLLAMLLEIYEKNRPDFIQLEEIMNNWDIN